MKRNVRNLAIVHFIILVAVIVWNYVCSSGLVNNVTVGDISNKYSSLFTPAGYAFSIWGLIYLGLITLAGYFLYCAFSESDSGEVVLKAGPTLIGAHLGNAAWLWFWVHEETALSVMVMVFILVMLIATVLRLNMERWDAPVKFMAFVWWPIDFYFGWIIVATIANVAAYLSKIGWDGGISEPIWTIIMITIAALIGIAIVLTRNMREVGAVVIWALLAIASRHWNTYYEIKWVAIIASCAIGLVCIIHAYKNRATLPFIRKD